MDSDDHAVLTPTFRGLVVVPADQRGHRAGQLLREGGAIGRRGEPHLAVDRERRQRLAGLGGAGDELARAAPATAGGSSPSVSADRPWRPASWPRRVRPARPEAAPGSGPERPRRRRGPG